MDERRSTGYLNTAFSERIPSGPGRCPIIPVMNVRITAREVPNTISRERAR